MVDVWLIFNLMMPLIEVLLHTYMDSLRKEDDEPRTINHHGESIVVGKAKYSTSFSYSVNNLLYYYNFFPSQ